MRRPSPGRSTLLLLCCLWIACTTPLPDVSDVDLEGWLLLRSPHFELLGDLSREQMERFAGDLAIFVAVVEKLANTSASDARVPVRIHLLGGRAADLLIPYGIGGYMSPRLDGYYGAVRVVGHTPAGRETLLHEYAHFLLRKGRALRYPTWYDEGFAEVVSTTRTRSGLVTVGTPAMGRLRDLPAREDLDLRTIFAPRRRSEILDAAAFYATSWAATHYLVTTPGGRKAMQRFVQLQVRGLGWQEAYASAFPVRIEELSRRVADHAEALGRGALLTVAEFDERELAADRRWSVQTLPEPAAIRALGQLALVAFEEERSFVVPAALFERALAIDPGDAKARAGLALAYARRGRFDAALREADRAAREAPGDPEVQLACAGVHRIRATELEEEDPESASASRRIARGAYERVRDASPRSPAAWAGIGWSYVAEGDPRAGIRALERARALGAWDSGVALDLGRLYRRSGDAERARRLWLEVARIGDPEAVEQADALLALLDAGDADARAASDAPTP